MRKVSTKIFGSILFIDAPPGDAPFEFRWAWIGKEVECLFRDDEKEVSVDAITGEAGPPAAAYVVRQSEALAALKEDSPEAYDYWFKAGYPRD